jgi:hypothetical protein
MWDEGAGRRSREGSAVRISKIDPERSPALVDRCDRAEGGW